MPQFIKPRGEWSSTEAYTERDLVSYQGSSWMARVPSTNTAPSNGDEWQLIAAAGGPGRPGDSVKGDRGDKGEQGDKGLAGNRGVRGPGGPQGAFADLVSVYAQPSCDNDGEAATIGVEVGHLYHSGSQLMIRMK